MIANEEQNIRAEIMPLQIVWRNPLSLVRARLRVKESVNSYYRWAEQARKIHARRANWDTNHNWAA
jgi:hypothetical protein